MVGLVLNLSNAPQAPADQAPSYRDALGAMLWGKYTDWQRAKDPIEQAWLSDIQAFLGEYDAATLAAIPTGRSKLYVHLTRVKVMGAYSRLVDMLFQPNDDNWGIEPTPIPTLKAGELKVILDSFAAAAGRPPTNEEQDKIVDDVASVSCENMSTAIRDQLAELRYDQKCASVIMEACILGTGVIEGVTTQTKNKCCWKEQAGSWEMGQEEVPFPDITPISAFDFYPDPYATEIDECSGVFRRYVLTREQLSKLRSHPGFDAEAISEILKLSPAGTYTQSANDVERHRLAGFTSSSGNNGRYEAVVYWGAVTGDDLASSGMDGVSGDQDYNANIWVVDGRTIMSRLSPVKPEIIPYHIFRYERVPHQFWGIGIPRQMRDSQRAVNAGARAAMDNASVISGPIGEVNTALLAPGENPNDIRGWKMFLREGGDPSTPMVRFYNVPNSLNEMMGIVDSFKRMADEETMMPSYTYGNSGPGLNSTASGMSMLMSASNVSLKSVIMNWDQGVTEPLIRSLYHWNMQWNQDEKIKGDMSVVAKGSASLLAKEMRSQRLLQFAQLTANPVDAQYVDRVGLLRKLAQTLDIDADDIIPEQQAPDATGGPGSLIPDGQQGMATGDGMGAAPVGAGPDGAGNVGASGEPSGFLPGYEANDQFAAGG